MNPEEEQEFVDRMSKLLEDNLKKMVKNAYIDSDKFDFDYQAYYGYRPYWNLNTGNDPEVLEQVKAWTKATEFGYGVANRYTGGFKKKDVTGIRCRNCNDDNFGHMQIMAYHKTFKELIFVCLECGYRKVEKVIELK